MTNRNGEEEIKNIYDAIKLVNKYNTEDSTRENGINEKLGDIYNEEIDKRLLICTSPYPNGIWFRGQYNHEHELTPAVFRKVNNSMYDETSLFYKFQLTLPEYQKDYSSNMDWLSFMQHYDLPTRLLDWSENILVALWFAVNRYEDGGGSCKQKYCDNRVDISRDDKDNSKQNECNGALYILNGIRLNRLARVSNNHLGLCYQNSLDVLIRSEMAAHRRKSTVARSVSSKYRDSSFGEVFKRKWLTEGNKCSSNNILKSICQEFKHFASNNNEYSDTSEGLKYGKLHLPIAVVPDRLNPRMQSQAGTFTLHGGKNYQLDNPCFTKPPEQFDEPYSIENLNNELNQLGKEYQIVKKFRIPGEYKQRIRDELLVLGIHRGYLFPEPEHQAKWLRGRWTY